MFFYLDFRSFTDLFEATATNFPNIFCKIVLPTKKHFLIAKTATKAVKTKDPCSHCSEVSFGGKSSSARISSHFWNGKFFCFLFSFICLRNWSRCTDIEHCLTEWIKHDSAPSHLICFAFVLEVVLPGNPKMHLDATLKDVDRYNSGALARAKRA